MKGLARQAQDLATHRYVRAAETWEDLRDRLDKETYGELDCQPLDILTDLVAKIRGIPQPR